MKLLSVLEYRNGWRKYDMNEMGKPVALVLGGTVPHCELIRQLQQRGYYAILIDYLDNPPAKYVADLHIQESTLDKEKVLEIARERNASLVICACVDQANITACYVMEQLGLQPPYSYSTAQAITNKGVMKQVMMEKKIPTSQYIYVDSPETVPDVELRYPVMVKPADSNSANGVKKAQNKAEMERYLKDAVRISRNGRAIIEEYVSGREISAYCFIKDKKAKLLMTAERISTFDGEDQVIKCYSSYAAAKISETATQNAEKIATQIAQAFELDNTPLFFQGIVIGDEIFVIEFAPRIGGGVCFHTIKGNTGFDVIAASIDSWLGIPVDLSSWHKPEQIYVVNTVYGRDGQFSHVTGSEKLLSDKVIDGFYLIKNRSDRLDNTRASSSRVAFFIVNGKDDAEVREKIRTAYRSLDVLELSGDSIIRRELNLDALWSLS